MKLSIVIICWNDLKVVRNCLQSIFTNTHATDFEVVVSDNGSTDGSIEYIRDHYPNVCIVENKVNLGFAKGNNAGIRVAQGEYILILNPDTIIHDGSLDRWLPFADRHPEAGAFGCRVLNPDGSYQISARLFPTVRRYWMSALYLRRLSFLSRFFEFEEYPGWIGESERVVDWQSGCCLLFRGDLLRQLGGFDEQFFYHFEEVDLCRRVWNAGYSIVFTPDATITHLGGQSVSRFPIRFQIERHRSRYRYFYKHFGPEAARQCKRLSIAWVRLRQAGYGVKALLPTAPEQERSKLEERLKMYRAVLQWNREVDPVRFVEKGEEPPAPA